MLAVKHFVTVEMLLKNDEKVFVLEHTILTILNIEMTFYFSINVIQQYLCLGLYICLIKKTSKLVGRSL
jgi:hypothetical protein